MKLSKIPKHIWWGVLLPIVLVGLGIWRLWPKIEEYRREDEREAVSVLSDFGSGGYHLYDGTSISRMIIMGKRHTSGPFQSPFNGYHLVTIQRDNANSMLEEYQQNTDAVGLSILDSDVYGFCAYPVQYDWRHRRTFIVNRSQKIFSLDNGGKPVTEWPSDEELAERFRLDYDAFR